MYFFLLIICIIKRFYYLCFGRGDLKYFLEGFVGVFSMLRVWRFWYICLRCCVDIWKWIVYFYNDKKNNIVYSVILVVNVLGFFFKDLIELLVEKIFKIFIGKSFEFEIGCLLCCYGYV